MTAREGTMAVRPVASKDQRADDRTRAATTWRCGPTVPHGEQKIVVPDDRPKPATLRPRPGHFSGARSRQKQADAKVFGKSASTLTNYPVTAGSSEKART